MKAKRHFFTLLEVIVSMAVFAIMMLGLMQFFSSAQKLWTATSSRASSGTEIKQALDTLVTDLQSAYAEDAVDPTVENRNKCFFYQTSSGIGFGTLRSSKADPDAATPLTAVFYRKSGNVLETRVVADNKVPSSEAWLTENLGSKNSILHTILDTAADNTANPNAASTNWEVIASNVAHFQVNLFSDTMGAFQHDHTKWSCPYLVRIRVVTVDEEAAKAIRNIDKNQSLGSLVDANGKITTSDAALEALLQGKVQVIQRVVVLERYIKAPVPAANPPTP